MVEREGIQLAYANNQGLPKIDLVASYGMNGLELSAVKAQSFAALIEEYQALKLKWGGFAGYDRLFAQRPNNALLASVAIYTDYVPFFVSLIEKYVGNLTPFYVEVRRLAALSRDERLAVMAAATGSINH